MSRGMRLAAADFRRFVELNAAPERNLSDPDRRSRLASVLDAVEPLLGGETRLLLAAIPRSLGVAMALHGWRWNGFYYARGDDQLHAGPAYGPPVCSPLERQGGPLTSGMCFDALDLNQTLLASDVKRWPGYVSCDETSGLSTVSGIVVPVRDPRGAPIAVWDLDSTEAVEAGDARFLDVFFASLASCIEIAPQDFAPQ